MITTPVAFPYRRDLRPPNPESLGEHTDREYEKIEAVIALLQDQISALKARIDTYGIP